MSERVAAAGRVREAFGPRVMIVLWNLVVASCFFSDRTSLAAGNRRGHWSTPRTLVELVLTSIGESSGPVAAQSRFGKPRRKRRNADEE